MNDQKFNALIRLLDDDDPVVQQQIEHEFITAGDTILPRLVEAQRSVEDAEIQNRLAELIGRLNFQNLAEELLTWRKEGGKDLLEGWILVSQFADPGLLVQKNRDAINRLVNRAWLQMKPGTADLEKLVILNKLIFGLEGYAPNQVKPELPDNNLLSYMLEHKTGNTLSMSLLYCVVAQKLDIPLSLVNFHGYYALRYYTRDQHFYLDPYNKGLFFTPQQVQRFLQKQGVDENMQHYKSLTNIYVVLQLIETIALCYERIDQPEQADRYRELLRSIEITFE